MAINLSFHCIESSASHQTVTTFTIDIDDSAIEAIGNAIATANKALAQANKSLETNPSYKTPTFNPDYVYYKPN